MTNDYIKGSVYWYRTEEKPTESLQAGTRPVVIVSNNFNNKYSTNVTVVPVTSQQKKAIPTHVVIRSISGRPEENIILCEQITTIPKTKLATFKCVLPKYIMDKVDKALAIQLGLTQPVPEKYAVKPHTDEDKLQFLTDAKALTDKQLAEKYNITANAVRTRKISWTAYFKNKNCK